MRRLMTVETQAQPPAPVLLTTDQLLAVAAGTAPTLQGSSGARFIGNGGEPAFPHVWPSWMAPYV